MADTFIFANDVSFNYPITNITQILPVYTTDTITNISCKTLDISGILTAFNMSCKNVAYINNISSASSYITINKPLQPTYNYDVSYGTNVLGSIGYIYSKQVTFTTTIGLNAWTDITGDFTDNISSGIYMSKIVITYKNISNITYAMKIRHYLGISTEIPGVSIYANNQFTTCIYFKNNNDEYTYTHNNMICIGPSQQLKFFILIPRYLLNVANIYASVVGNTYNLSLLTIA
jgi:hypothetical protein